MTSTARAQKRMLKFLPAIGLAAVALGVAGCKTTGGGFIASATGADAAHFGFVMQDAKKGTVVKGSYRDGYVQFRLDGGSVVFQPNPCATWNDNYVSTNPDFPGSGTVRFVVCDNGEPGPTNGDSLSIDVLSGPYAGYTNSGTLEGGNLQINQNQNSSHSSRHHTRH